jgi:hypothetical protein
MSDIPQAIHEDEIEIMGITLRVAVLDDGRRVIYADDVARIMAAMAVCEHQWDGPVIPIKHGSSLTCSKCGLDAYSHSLRMEEA